MNAQAGAGTVSGGALEHMNDAVVQRMLAAAPIGHALCQALESEQRKLGLDAEPPVYEAAWFELSVDPFDGELTLTGGWRNGAGRRVGGLVIHADGSSFAEYDVLIPHPRDPRWFVEAVTAWGRDGTIRSEPRLLQMPE